MTQSPIEKAKEALKECADDLEAELKSRYPADSYERYPSQKIRFERDMGPVYRAREALKALEGE